MKTITESTWIRITQDNVIDDLEGNYSPVINGKPQAKGDVVSTVQLLMAMQPDGWQVTQTNVTQSGVELHFQREVELNPTREEILRHFVEILLDEGMTNNLVPVLEKMCDDYGIEKGKHESTRLVQILNYALEAPEE